MFLAVGFIFNPYKTMECTLYLPFLINSSRFQSFPVCLKSEAFACVIFNSTVAILNTFEYLFCSSKQQWAF